jgi:urate oxidase
VTRPPDAVIGTNRYGKSGIRLLRVGRDRDQHRLSDLEVSTALAGDLDAVHTAGDNTGLLPTDSQKNAVYALARRYGVDPIEEFAVRLARHFVRSSPAIAQATVTVMAHQWHPIPVAGRAQPHAFQRGDGERRLARVRLDEDGHSITSGLDGVVALRTAGSSFTGFLRDEFTTLPEAADRILATSVQADWRYLAGVAGDWDRYHTTARQSLLSAFADTDSGSLQHTLYQMGQRLLEDCQEIAEVHLTLPNQHHHEVDLSPFGLTNDGEVFEPQDRPYGLIEGVVRRGGLPPDRDRE